ncbi:hypothetical protein ACIBCN_19025 [Nocardia sp. NPDC051052]|uniref:hypothetical protein n=1 Tax=Nocardia sp. NPDC051052 TaxID=3364322 RepID=UPI00379323E9
MTSVLYTVDGRVVPPRELVRTANGWAEPVPVRCPAGHPLRSGRTLVGWIPCLAPGRTGHRTHQCECRQIVCTPEPDDACSCQLGQVNGRKV